MPTMIAPPTWTTSKRKKLKAMKQMNPRFQHFNHGLTSNLLGTPGVPSCAIYSDPSSQALCERFGIGSPAAFISAYFWRSICPQHVGWTGWTEREAWHGYIMVYQPIHRYAAILLKFAGNRSLGCTHLDWTGKAISSKQIHIMLHPDS